MAGCAQERNGLEQAHAMSATGQAEAGVNAPPVASMNGSDGGNKLAPPDAGLPVVGAPSDAETNREADHLCYVFDDCNHRDHWRSAASCPPTPPVTGTGCALGNEECYYCPPGTDVLHWYSSIVQHRCKDGSWATLMLNPACE